eukprot:971483-Rhodomonas_salina.1
MRARAQRGHDERGPAVHLVSDGRVGGRMRVGSSPPLVPALGSAPNAADALLLWGGRERQRREQRSRLPGHPPPPTLPPHPAASLALKHPLSHPTLAPSCCSTSSPHTSSALVARMPRERERRWGQGSTKLSRQSSTK